MPELSDANLPILTPSPDRNPARGFEGPDTFFTGKVWVNVLHEPAEESNGMSIVAVYFDTGARNRPHTHSSDQVLYFISGTGFVHMAGGDEQHVPVGSAVVIPADVPHMHGATDEGPCMHIALRTAGAASGWEFDELPDDWDRWCRA